MAEWMSATNHLAMELMKEPYNQELIDAYMQWETKNAREEIDELLEILKKRKKHN